MTNPLSPFKVKELTESISRVVLSSTKGTAVTKAAVHRRKQSSGSGLSADSPSEQPSVARQNTMDEYGFEIAQTPEQVAISQRCAQQDDKQRVKWSQYPRDGPLPPEDKLKKLCRRGIPPEIRKWVWMEISGANRRKAKHYNEYYVSMATMGKLQSPFKHQIMLDVPRTFPNNAWLQTDAGQTSISRVLLAFSLHNPGTGYCQGMNYLAATLLLILGHDEEAAFWVLASLIDTNSQGILYQDMYSSDLSGTHVEMRSLMELIESKLPRLAAHMEYLRCDISILATDWFLCLFSTSLPSETVARVWDALLHEGPKILFRVALALLKLHEHALLEQDNPGDILRTIRRVVAEEYDRDELMQVAFGGLGTMSMGRIAKYRQSNQKQVDTEFAERQTRTNLRNAQEEGFVLEAADEEILTNDNTTPPFERAASSSSGQSSSPTKRSFTLRSIGSGIDKAIRPRRLQSME